MCAPKLSCKNHIDAKTKPQATKAPRWWICGRYKSLLDNPPSWSASGLLAG